MHFRLRLMSLQLPPAMLPAFHGLSFRISLRSPMSEIPASSCLERIRSSQSTVLFVVVLALLVDSLVYSVVIPILPIFVTSSLHLDSSDVGYLFASYSVGLLIATPIFGYLTDRFGRKWPLLSGLLLMVVACFGFAYASTYWQLLLSRFAQGFSGAASWVIGLAMIADVYPLSEVGVAMGTVMALNSIGFLIGPTIGGVMYDGLGFRASFMLCAGLALLDFLVRIFFITDEALQRMYIQASDANRAAGLSLSFPIAAASEDKQPQTVVIDVPVTDAAMESPLDTPFSHVPTVTYGSQSPTAVAADVSQPQTAVVTLTLLDLLRDRSFLILSYCTTVLGIFFGGLEPIWALHLQNAFNCSPTQIGLLFLVVVIPNALGSVGVGYLADRYSKKWLIGIGTLLLAATIPLLAIFQRDGQLLYFALMLSVVGTTASIPITPILPLLSAMVTAKNSRSFGSVYSTWVISYSFGTMAGPLVSSAVYEAYGFGWTMGACALLVLSSVPLLTFAEVSYADTSATNAANTAIEAIPMPASEVSESYQTVPPA